MALVNTYLDLDLREFQKLIFNAESVARCLPNKDLYKAFTITLDMMRHLGDLMNVDRNQMTKEAPPLFDHRTRSFEHGYNALFTNNAFKRVISPQIKLQSNCVKNEIYSSEEEDNFETGQKQVVSPIDEIENGDMSLLPSGNKKPRCRSTSPHESNSSFLHKPTEINLRPTNVSSHSAPCTYGMGSPPPPELKKSLSPNGAEISNINAFAQFMNLHQSNRMPSFQPENNGSKLLQSGTEDAEDKTVRTPNDIVATPANNLELRHWRVANADRLNALIDECERHIDGRKVYKCKFCGKVYEIKSSMRYHMKIIHLQLHLKTSEMQCRVCGKQFTCISAVNRHQSKCLQANGIATTAPQDKPQSQRSPSPQSPSPYSFTDGLVQGRNPVISLIPNFHEKLPAGLNPKLFNGNSANWANNFMLSKPVFENGNEVIPVNFDEMLSQLTHLTKNALIGQNNGENLAPSQESFTSAFLRHLNSLSTSNVINNNIDSGKMKISETDFEKIANNFGIRRFSTTSGLENTNPAIN